MAKDDDSTLAALNRRLGDLKQEIDRLETILSGGVGPGRGIALAKCVVTVDRAAEALAKHNERLEE